MTRRRVAAVLYGYAPIHADRLAADLAAALREYRQIHGALPAAIHYHAPGDLTDVDGVPVVADPAALPANVAYLEVAP